MEKEINQTENQQNLHKEENNNAFQAYEYLTLKIKKEEESFLTDAYKNFGWELVEKQNMFTYTELHMKRNYKIKNREELVSLQNEFEKVMRNVDKWQNYKTQAATGWSLSVGFAGTACLAGATFSYLAELIGLCVGLAVPGFVCWGISYFIYKKIKADKTKRANLQLEILKNQAYTICEDAYALL